MFSYSPPEPGEYSLGYGMVSDRFILVVATEIGHARATALWDLISAMDTTMADVLGALARRGLEAVPDFAIVELVDPSTRRVAVALRGAGVVHLLGDESHRLTGEGAGTWIESTVERVQHMSVGLHSAVPRATALPFLRGVVLADRVHLGATAATSDVVHPEGTNEPVAAGLESANDEPATIDPAGDTAADDDTPEWAIGVTMTGRPERAAPAGDADEATILGERASRSIPASAPPFAFDDQTLLASRSRGPALGLVFGDGRTLALSRPTLVGRNPKSERAGVATHVLRSPKKEVSGTHAELEVVGEALRVRDLGSTNGTIVTPRGGSPKLLRDSDEALLSEGSSIDFGDGNRAVFARLS
ncbi:FHA domain-containing protein [uncultured Microbacterium sp.]|mgnify:CR=1 FL=1|uniref:FHA domain-containing protein n=1 Tax=uncultured Microbacterium sp. TaxID=191216 RepID=UPI0025D8EA15|nr:FHA domain-containing protein [uncultured Microbacterium sp.]